MAPARSSPPEAAPPADRIRGSSNDSTNIDSNITGADLSAGATLIIQGFYREAVTIT